ncbi:zinc finger protein 235-like [Bacillus rossius redtenbacheri]|uniref:zinc finger protein 235-like n=1 Tax=Bacillus rossius redtenbacheri TaxID=93214 RepID=UPI002FDE2D48
MDAGGMTSQPRLTVKREVEAEMPARSSCKNVCGGPTENGNLHFAFVKWTPSVDTLHESLPLIKCEREDPLECEPEDAGGCDTLAPVSCKDNVQQDPLEASVKSEPAESAGDCDIPAPVVCEDLAEQSMLSEIKAEQRLEGRHDSAAARSPGRVALKSRPVHRHPGQVRGRRAKNGTAIWAGNDCPSCGRGFADRPSFKEHLVTAECCCAGCRGCPPRAERAGGEGQWCCEICSEYFDRQCSLAAHMSAHTGTRVLFCRLCGRLFQNKGSLHAHLRGHLGERPFRCNYCSKAFVMRSPLSKHVKVHLLFGCDHCGRAFARKELLIDHIQGHSDDGPFDCDYCGESFARKDVLAGHIGVHVAEGPFRCGCCGEKFLRKELLAEHERDYFEERLLANLKVNRLHPCRQYGKGPWARPESERPVPCKARFT